MKALLLPALLLLLCFVGIMSQNGKGNLVSILCTAPIIVYGLYQLVGAGIGYLKDRKNKH